MRKLQPLTPRARVILTASVVALAGLLLAILLPVVVGEKSAPTVESSEERRKTAAAPADDSEKENGAPKWTAEQLADGMRPWQPGVEHPWLALAHRSGRGGFRYSGPQTAEALATVFYWGPIYEGRREEMLAHIQRVLDLGHVIQYDRDAMEYGHTLIRSIREKRKQNAAFAEKEGLSEEAYLAQHGLSIEEFENGTINGHVRYWAIAKEQFFHASETGEGTLNVRLYPGGGMYIKRIGAGGRPQLTDAERHNISRHGVAPKGYRLRLLGKNFMEELPLGQVPFISERDVIKKMKKADLEELLVAVPTYLIQPEAVEKSDVMRLSMVDRYGAALEHLASRNQIPKPFAGRKPPPPPSEVVRSAAPAGAVSLDAPIEMREPLSAPPAEPRDEAALAKAEQRQRIALAFLEALEKAAKKNKMNPAARTLIAMRLWELRIMQNPDLLKPPSPSQQPAQDNNGGSKEE